MSGGRWSGVPPAPRNARREPRPAPRARRAGVGSPSRFRWRKAATYAPVTVGICVVGRLWSPGFQSLATYPGPLSAAPDIHLTVVESPEDVCVELRERDVDLILTDYPFMGHATRCFIESLQQLPDCAEVVVVGLNDSPAERARLLAAGCMAVIPDGLTAKVLAETLPGFLARVQRQANTRIRVQAESSLLITGETGVGKERLARQRS